jgi:hypothetical protein
MLLLKRYDLKLGLWDLALDPVLRSTVLESLPVRPAPDEPVQAPVSERKRAERKAEKATARREATQLAVGEVTAALKQELEPVGWRVDNALWPVAPVRKSRPWLYLPLTEPLPSWPDGPGHPFVVLRIDVNKSSIRLSTSAPSSSGGAKVSNQWLSYPRSPRPATTCRFGPQASVGATQKPTGRASRKRLPSTRSGG